MDPGIWPAGRRSAVAPIETMSRAPPVRARAATSPGCRRSGVVVCRGVSDQRNASLRMAASAPTACSTGSERRNMVARRSYRDDEHLHKRHSKWVVPEASAISRRLGGLASLV
ncbi:hypothetical protein SEVIR_7G175901v4 [Setaria viridis]